MGQRARISGGCRPLLLWAVVAICFLSRIADAQTLRFSNHREVKPPEDATLRIGPFYSTLYVSQSVGARYTRLQGTGTDFLTSNDKGEIKEEGFEAPIISTLGLQNYLIVSRTMDLQFSVRLSYAYYPMRTQEDAFTVDLDDEGIYADLSTEMYLASNMRVTLSDAAAYRTDFIDTRGIEDRYGGDQYVSFENKISADLDWMVSPYDNVAASVSRSDVIPFSGQFEDREHVGYAESLAWERQFTRFMTGGIRLSGQQSMASKPSRPDAFQEGVDVFGGVQLTRFTAVNGSLGIAQARTKGGDPPVDESSQTLAGSAGITQELTKYTRHSLQYMRGYQEAFLGGYDASDGLTYSLSWATQPLPGSFSTGFNRMVPVDPQRSGYTSWDTRLQLNHQLTRRIGLTFLTSYAIRWNVGIEEEAPLDVTEDYRTWVNRLTADLLLFRRVKLSAYMERAARTSPNEDLNYVRDIAAVDASTGFAWGHRF